MLDECKLQLYARCERLAEAAMRSAAAAQGGRDYVPHPLTSAERALFAGARPSLLAAVERVVLRLRPERELPTTPACIALNRPSGARRAVPPPPGMAAAGARLGRGFV